MENQIILIDTSILITHFRKGSNKFEHFCQLQDKGKISLGVSVITLFEYYSGVAFDDSISLKQADELFELFEIYEVNKSIVKIAAQINNRLKLQQKIKLADILIGATAIHLNCPLLTENKKHFKLIPNLKFV